MGRRRAGAREHRQPGVGTRRGWAWTLAVRAGRRLGVAVAGRALPVFLPRLRIHYEPRSMIIK